MYEETIHIGGEVTKGGVNLGLLWPGDPDYRMTSLIVQIIDDMHLKKKVVSYSALSEKFGKWSPHHGEEAGVYSLSDFGERNVRVALSRYGYQVIK